MEQIIPTNEPKTAEAVTDENRPKVTLETIVVQMMQTYKDLQAYHRGENTLHELHASGTKRS